ncbi:alpha-L-arabinofuranosidase [Flavisolibacter nicotianae]|uniref:alpha-L-arabinofuranosidase n=1 Tax=Flavisolibacter nicotianae TaxID=2364882 RepID=UPI000EADD0DA|nr:alpha-L-arabinofuranosidase [Flavisolibacter nicotianae]
MKKLHFLSVLLVLVFSFSCKKTSNSGSGNANGGNTGGGAVVTPTEPAVENTIGFFLDTWTPKNFTVPTAYTEAAVPTESPAALVTIDASKIITKVSSFTFGQNTNTWMTQIVTEPALSNHLSTLKPTVLRFPGGSISDVFFWNAENNKLPADVPASLLDAEGKPFTPYYWYGKNTDPWTFSVDNYYRLRQQTGSEGLITVNYGYARYGTGPNPVAQAAHLAADWVRYDNGRTKYWEIGNESNGTWEAGYRINTVANRDGQPEMVTGALYGQHVGVFIDSMRKAAQEIGKTIYIGAYILEKQPENWQTSADKGWNSGVFGAVANKPDYYVIHSYYTPYKTNASADAILATASDNTTAMMTYVKQNMTAAGVTIKPVALDEWNITSEGSLQQVSFINGMHATILLGEAIKNKYGMTSRWDLANGWANGNDHGLFNIGDEPGVSKWNPRPAFYYMYYFQKMMGDRMLSSSFLYGGTGLLAYASSFTSGEKGVILVNKDKTAKLVQVGLDNAKPGSRFYWYTLAGGTDNGEFSRKVYVNNMGPSEPSGGPATEYTTIKPYSASTSGGIKVALPARSVVYMVIDK